VVCVLAWSGLLQAAQAEKRSLLRAQRAREATPFITLPQSLLLQSSGGENQRQLTGEEQSLSDADASKEIKAAANRGGYGNQLWSAVQESAGEVVDDAREAFFADSMKAAAKATTVAATTVTTTIAITTVDPAVLAQQLKISKEAAQARNILVSMIERAQIGLLNRLKDISLDLEATELRAKLDLKAVNHSFTEAKNMPISASNADIDVKKIQTNGDQLKKSIPALVGRASTHSTEIAQLLRSKKQSEKDLKDSSKLPGAKRRIQNNQQTLNAVIPRLERLETRVTKLESKLYDGDLNKMVEDTSSKEVMNIMEDVSRGFGRFIKNT